MAFSFGIAEFKAGFFDAAALHKEIDRVERQTLSRFGAFTRTRMKSSIRYVSGKSSPGKPPNAHKKRGFNKLKKTKTGAQVKQPVSPLRELIYFAYDPASKSVVVGPVKFGGKGGVAPKLLEKGGPGTFKTEDGEIKRGVWAPRPFVKPAGEAEVKAGKFLAPKKGGL